MLPLQQWRYHKALVVQRGVVCLRVLRGIVLMDRSDRHFWRGLRSVDYNGLPVKSVKKSVLREPRQRATDFLCIQTKIFSMISQWSLSFGCHPRTGFVSCGLTDVCPNCCFKVCVENTRGQQKLRLSGECNLDNIKRHLSCDMSCFPYNIHITKFFILFYNVMFCDATNHTCFIHPRIRQVVQMYMSSIDKTNFRLFSWQVT